MKKACLILTFIFLTVIVIKAEENFNTFLSNAEKYFKEGKYAKAIEELDWAKKVASDNLFKKLKSYFPEKVPDFTAEDFEGGDVFGIQGISRTYTHNKSGGTIKITIYAGSKTGLGGLASMIGFASMMAGMDKSKETGIVTSHGIRGNLIHDKNNKETTVVFSLQKNVFVVVEGNGFDTPELTKKFAEMLDVASIEKEFL